MASSLTIDNDERGVFTLTLNRPERHNALDSGLVESLVHQLTRISRRQDARVIVLTGNGATFCSGMDLQEGTGGEKADIKRRIAQLATLMQTLYTLPQATIARINGPAFGGGVGLIACCDFAIATPASRFAFTETRVGLVPAIIAPYIINAIGARQAKRYFLSADAIDAPRALALGLVEDLTPAHRLDEAVRDRVEGMLRAGPDAIAETKQLISSLLPISYELVRRTVELSAAARTSSEGREGVAAFQEKREPHWSPPPSTPSDA